MQQTERSLLAPLGNVNVLFAFDKAGLSAQAGLVLGKPASFAAQFPGRRVPIAGFTYNGGHNRPLSGRRVWTARDALAQRGADRARILGCSPGYSHLVASCASPEDRFIHRRAGIAIADSQDRLRSR